MPGQRKIPQPPSVSLAAAEDRSPMPKGAFADVPEDEITATMLLRMCDEDFDAWTTAHPERTRYLIKRK